MRCPFKKNIAGVAQSVVQLIRNQQVVCSSHITSSKNPRTSFSGFYFFTFHSSLFTFHSTLTITTPRYRVIRNLPFGQCCIRSCVRVTFPCSKNPRTQFSGFYFFTLLFSLFTLHFSLFQTIRNLSFDI